MISMSTSRQDALVKEGIYGAFSSTDKEDAEISY